jgi:hypothetical protein
MQWPGERHRGARPVPGRWCRLSNARRRSGYLGILPGDTASLAELGSGELSYTVEGRRRTVTIDGG